MSKPTFWQSILNLPTRTYLDPHQPTLFSTPVQYQPHPSEYATGSVTSLTHSSFVTARSDSSDVHNAKRIPGTYPPRRPLSERSSSLSLQSSASSRSALVTRHQTVEQKAHATNNRTMPTSIRPNPSRSTNSDSLRSFASNSDLPSNNHPPSLIAHENKPSLSQPQLPHTRPLPPGQPPRESTYSVPALAPSPVPPELDNPQQGTDNTDTDSDEAEDVFYTPFSSPPGSPEPKPLPPTPSNTEAASTSKDMSLIETVKISVGSMMPKSGIHVSPPPSSSLATGLPKPVHLTGRTPSVSMYASTSSLPSMTTTPLSDGTYSDFSWRSSSSRSDTTASSKGASKHNLNRRDTSTGSGSDSRSRRGESRRSLDELTADWAKEVRWLLPPEEMVKQAQQKKNPPRSRSVSSSSSSSRRTDPNSSNSINTSSAPRRRPRIRTPEPSNMPDRMSAVLEVDETGEQGAGNQVIGSTQSSSQSRGPPLKSAMRRSRTHSGPSSRSRQSQSFSEASFKTAASSRTVVLPSPLPVSDGTGSAGKGYTSLVLPRAAYVPQPVKYSEKVDLTLGGLAQTTMSTISITKHAADMLTNNRARRLSITIPFFMGGKSRLETPLRLLSGEPSPLSFTSATSPPSKVHSHQVLVQVWAVGIDGMDHLIVHEKAQKADGNGFIPGRSFVGRVIECGWEVSNISKGEWVLGLLDMTKCGALAEFIAVDRRRVHTAPTPSPTLPLEHMALLPLLGVPARRAIKTISAFPKGLDALVLQANHGTGLLVTEELVAQGARVICQVEDQAAAAWVRSAGAADVLIADPITAIDSLPDSSVDVIIDMVGGKDIWDASRRIFRSSGSQFTTIVGDSQTTVPTTNALAKGNMRSLRRAFARKDRKIIGYEWVSLAADVDHEGEDVRDSLSIISKMASEGSMAVPALVAESLPFEKTPDLFKPLNPMALPSVSSFKLTVIRVVG